MVPPVQSQILPSADDNSNVELWTAVFTPALIIVARTIRVVEASAPAVIVILLTYLPDTLPITRSAVEGHLPLLAKYSENAILPLAVNPTTSDTCARAM